MIPSRDGIIIPRDGIIIPRDVMISSRDGIIIPRDGIIMRECPYTAQSWDVLGSTCH